MNATKISSIIGDDGLFRPSFIHWVARQPETVFLETTLPGKADFRSYIFCRPDALIACTQLAEVEGCLREVQHALTQGHHVAGFLTYEAGYAFEDRLRHNANSFTPLLWFGVYTRPATYNHHQKSFETGWKELADFLLQPPDDFSTNQVLARVEIVPSQDEKAYGRALARIKNDIAAGDTYQVNHTFKLKFPFTGSPAELYCRLRRAQRVGYSALISLKPQTILSFSPELFFRVEDGLITLRPMKGTAPRGRTLEEDGLQRRALQESEKNRAENLMIVDLLRNDVGKIAEIGSVAVPSFFDVERYETVHQATSTITAQLPRPLTVLELMRSLFPSGSVTGAPKLRTMQIIRELEREPRGVYTGSIGFFAPERRAVFSVAIRTVVLDHARGHGEMGVGSGVVWDSDAEAEYQECLLKARFLTEPEVDFQLLETLRWEKTAGYFLLEEHLRRLEGSASYFGFPYDKRNLLQTLEQHAQRLVCDLESPSVFRVRLTLARNGTCDLTHAPLDELPARPRIGFACWRTNSQDRRLFHKTTRRELYDQELTRAAALGWFDAIFLNEREEVTEGARSNLIVKHGGQYLTPPVNCGLLPGVYRAHLLASQAMPLAEKILTREDLRSAEEVFVCNAVRGLVKVELEV